MASWETCQDNDRLFPIHNGRSNMTPAKNAWITSGSDVQSGSSAMKIGDRANRHNPNSSRIEMSREMD